jgi:hypothetical protein
MKLKWQYIAAVICFIVGFIMLGIQHSDATRCKVDSPCDPDAGHHNDPEPPWCCIDGQFVIDGHIVKIPKHRPHHPHHQATLPNTGA